MRSGAAAGAKGPAMLIGVPKEVKTHEYRVGLVPGSVRELVHHGHKVVVETGAGAGIRLVTPLGPLALDLGFNLRPDTAVNEPLYQVQFAVGLF